MANKKVVFITIIVLLCLFLPLTIIGFINKDNRNLLDANPNHDFFYKGSLWFYDQNDKLLSTYECQTEICELTTPTIDDGAYNINYYKEGKNGQVSIEDNKYTFITDGAVIYLYDIVAGTTLDSYKSVKNYNTNLANDTYIIQNNEGLWGALTIGNMLNRVLNFEYDFVGLIDDVSEAGLLNTNKFIVQKDSKWYLVDNAGNSLTGEITDPIVDYNDEYIFSKNTERIRIFSYQNYEYLTNYKIKDYILVDKYIGIVTDNFLLIYENLGTSYLKSITLTNVTGDISIEKEDNKLNIKVSNEIIESVELS